MQAEVPLSLSSSQKRQSIPSKSRIIRIASQSGDQTGGGLISFQIPHSGVYMKAGSAYIKFKIKATTTVGTEEWLFAGSCHSAAAVFQRYTLYGNSAVLEQIGGYDKLYDAFLAHCSSDGFSAGDARILMDARCAADVNVATGGNAAASTVEVCVPLLSGVLNAAQHFPLWAVGGNLVLNFDLNTAANALQATANTITNFTISAAELVFEQIEPDAAFVMAMRQSLEAGQVYSLPFVAYRNVVASANQITANQTLGLNVSSLRSVLWTNAASKADTTGRAALSSQDQKYAKLYIDGELATSFDILGAGAQSFAEMNRALGRINDTDRSSLRYLTPADYSAKYFLGGVNTTRTDQSDLTMNGTPVNVAQLEIEKTTPAAGSLYIWAVHDCLLQIGAGGSVIVRT